MPRHSIVIVLLLLALTAIAAPYLDMALWTDEMATIRQVGAPPLFAPLSPGELVTILARDNPWQAPGYFVLLSAWGTIAGWEPLTLRLLSLFPGLIAVALVYSLARRHISAEVGVYAALATGMTAFYVNYLVDMRTYALTVALTGLALWSYERVIRRGRPHHYVALALTVAALFYTHYFAAFGCIGLGILHLLFGHDKPRYRSTLAAFIVGGLLFLPWAAALLDGLGRSEADARAQFNMSLGDLLTALLDESTNDNPALLLLLGVIALRVRQRFVWLWLIATISALLIATRFFPALHDTRYVLFLFPALGVIIGMGVAELHRLGVSPLIVMVIWGVLFWQNVNGDANPRGTTNYRPPFAALGDQMVGRGADDDRLLYILPERAPNDINHPFLLAYYTAAIPLDERTLIADTAATTDAFYAQQIIEAVDDAPRLWLSYERSRRNWRFGPVSDQQLPQLGYVKCGDLTPSGARVHLELWAEDDAIDERHPLVFQAEGGTVHVALDAAPTSSGDVFIWAHWEHDDTLRPGQYSLAAFLLDDSGQVAAQIDQGLAQAWGCTAHDAPVAAGTYTLALTVYAWENGTRLLPVDAEHTDGLVMLGSVPTG